VGKKSNQSKQKKTELVPESRLDDIIYWGLVVFFFVQPLAIFPLTAEIFELPKATLLRLFALFVLVFWTARTYQLRSIRLRRTYLDVPVVFYGAVAVLATVFSINPGLSVVGGYYRYEGLPTILSYLLIFFAVTNFVPDPRRARYLIYALLASATLTGLYGIFQHFGLDFIRLTGKVFELTRSSGTFGNPIFLGAFLVLMIPVAVSLLIRTGGAKQKLVLSAAMTVMLACLILTQTRGAWLGLALSFVFLGVTFLRKGILKDRRILAGLLSLAVLVGAVSLSLYIFEPNASVVRRVRTAIERSGSVATRLDMWTGSMKLIRNRPLIGYGWETFDGIFPKYGTTFLMSVEELPDRPHNGFLYLGASSGLLGWLAFLWIVTVTFWHGTRKSSGLSYSYAGAGPKKQKKALFAGSESTLLAGLMGGIVAYIAQEQFSFSLAGVTPVFWTFLGLMGLLRSSLNSDRSPVLSLKVKPAQVVFLILISLSLVILGATFNARVLIADYRFRAWQERELKGVPADIALNSIESAVRLNPYVSQYRASLIEAFAGQATATGDPQWTEQAIAVAEEGLLLNPKDEGLLIRLGDLHFYQPRGRSSYGKALAAYRRVLRLHPKSAAARWALGDVNLAAGKYGLAIEELEHAAALVPQHAGVRFSLGLAYEKAGKLADAEAAFRKVLELEPQKQEAKEALQRLTK
jgi:putative inorganic carbon (HCO3(-)) transporter